MNNRTVNVRPVVVAALAVAAVVALLWLAFQLQRLLLVLLAAVILAAGLARLANRLERLRVPRTAAAVLPLLFLVGAVVALASRAGAILIDEAQTLARDVPSVRDAALGLLSELGRLIPPLRQVEPLLTPAVQDVATQLERDLLRPEAPTAVGQALLAFFGGVVALLFVLALTLYLLVDREQIRAYALSLVPAARRDGAARLADRAAYRTSGWIAGQAAVCALVGAVTFLVLSLIGVRYPLLLSMFAALAELVPLIGPFSAGALGVLVASTQSTWQAVLTLLFYVTFQQIDGYFLGPRIIGAAVRLHPLVVLLAIAAAADLFGLGGALLGPPLAAALSVLVDEWRKRAAA